MCNMAYSLSQIPRIHRHRPKRIAHSTFEIASNMDMTTIEDGALQKHTFARSITGVEEVLAMSRPPEHIKMQSHETMPMGAFQ